MTERTPRSPQSPPADPDVAARSVWAWAIYLAVSWTWCIGMFLPALLTRDLGPWALLAFAAPNLLGAALVGWTGVADRLREAHTHAVRAFSLVTIAFQAFFGAVLASRLGPIGGGAVLATFTLVWMLHTAQRAPFRATQVVFGISLLAGAVLLWKLGGRPPTSVHAQPSTPADLATDIGAIDLLSIAPVIAFGFLLCPPLDATFQHARREMSPTPVSTTPRSRAAFTLAFALCFPMLIALTPLYANVARGVVLQPGFITPGLVLMLALCAHLAAQLGATSALHAREYPATARGRDAIPAALAAGVACAIAALLTPTLLGLTGVEMVYRLFMTAYGLLFPAYVWIVLWTSRASLNTPRTQRLTLALWCAACVVATPFYWIGFVMRIEPWLVPGLAIVLASGPLAAALARRTKSDTRSIF